MLIFHKHLERHALGQPGDYFFPIKMIQYLIPLLCHWLTSQSFILKNEPQYLQIPSSMQRSKTLNNPWIEPWPVLTRTFDPGELKSTINILTQSTDECIKGLLIIIITIIWTSLYIFVTGVLLQSCHANGPLRAQTPFNPSNSSTTSWRMQCFIQYIHLALGALLQIVHLTVRACSFKSCLLASNTILQYPFRPLLHINHTKGYSKDSFETISIIAVNTRKIFSHSLGFLHC